MDFSISELYEDYVPKLLYVQNRLGIDIEKYGINDFLNDYKIVLNLSDFLQTNKIDLKNRFKYDKQKEMLNMINEKFIGFMSIDKNFITFRNVVDNEPRYNNFRLIVDDEDSNKKIYMIKNEINLMNPIYDIYITEGVFDIIGLQNYLNKTKKLKNNEIFLACNGKSHLLAFNSLLSMGITNCNINIFSDKDVNLNFYKHMKKESPLLKFNGATIYYNELGKDYGVKPSEIKLSKPYKI